MKITVSYFGGYSSYFFPIHNVYIVLLFKHVSALGSVSFRDSNKLVSYPSTLPGREMMLSLFCVCQTRPAVL